MTDRYEQPKKAEPATGLKGGARTKQTARKFGFGIAMKTLPRWGVN